MKLNRDETENRKMSCVQISAVLTLVLALFLPGAGAQTQAADTAASKGGSETYQTLYLTSLTQTRDANDIQTDLRNMLPNARLFFVPSQNAISMRGTPDEVKLAQKILSDIDRTRSVYRLTYTITDLDNGKKAGTQQFALVVASGGKTELKQGIKVPIVTGSFDGETSKANTQVQYLDVGLKHRRVPRWILRWAEIAHKNRAVGCC